MVEDSEDDALLTLRELRRGGYEPLYERVDTADAMKAALTRQTWDIVLSDYNMPQFNGNDALLLLKKTELDLPFILITGTIGEEKAAAIVKEGAHDYIIKGKLRRLIPAIQRELQAGDERRRRKDAEKCLRKFSLAVDRVRNIIFLTDAKGNIEYVNAMFEEVTGYAKEEAMGKNPRILSTGETAQVVYENMWKTIMSGETWRGVFKNKKKDGHYYWCNCIIYPVVDLKEAVTNYLCVQEDITEKRDMEENMKRLTLFASFDGLTGLINRMRFMELMDDWMSYARTKHFKGVLLLIDIDRFRLINDTYGGKVGDALLQKMAKFLTDAITTIDIQYFTAAEIEKEVMESILCRMGGDEFAVFLPLRSETEGIATAEELRKNLELFPFMEFPGHITVSIGIVVFPDHGDTLYDLFKKVDASVYHAKEIGRNRSHVYRPEDLLIEKMTARIEWKGHIKKALKEDRFELWFQPILDLKTGAVYHYEVLARMRGENGEIIMPGKFIDTAEAFGLIGDISRVIIEKTLKIQSALKKQGKECFFFSMNFSGKDLEDKELLQFLKNMLTETMANSAYLIFEITETAAIQDLHRAVKFIRELRSLGCKFSLDDFGVGFTSFKYLKEMEVDYIKIDGAFITKLLESKSDRLFVKAMVDVAQGMGIKTVAEFVENKDIVQVLKEIGVDYAQGYYIGKPGPDIKPP